MADQWRCCGARIPERSERREAFNIMLAMPAGTNPEVVRNAARQFAKAELSNYRYVMVLHTHQVNPHVHLAVRAEGRDGKRLNPRKQDLRRWREVFAERLRGLGIEAEATSKIHAAACTGTSGSGSERLTTTAGLPDAPRPPTRSSRPHGGTRRRRGARSPRRSRRRRTWLTASWADRSSTTRGGCPAYATSRQRSSRSASCLGWSGRLCRRRGPIRGGSDEPENRS